MASYAAYSDYTRRMWNTLHEHKPKLDLAWVIQIESLSTSHSTAHLGLWLEFEDLYRNTNSCLRAGGEVRIIFTRQADMAQLVEHHLAKVGVAGSNPVVRSIACSSRSHL